jgi:hypothetical protein
LPADLSFQFVDRGAQNRGDAYVTAWEKNGKFISLLFGLTLDSKNINYIRIWIMPPGESVTQDQAESLLADVYSAEFLTSVGTPACGPAMDPQTNATITECAKLITTSEGNLEGITVRTPFQLQPLPGTQQTSSPSGQSVIIVSSCYVPKDGAPVYPGQSCI